MLIVTRKDTTVFESNGKWLHPLLELGIKIEEEGLPAEELSLHDSVIGRAAALLIVRMGVKNCRGDLMSRRALPVLEQAGLDYTYGTLVDKIACQTEDLLAGETDPEAAYRFILNRIEAQK